MFRSFFYPPYWVAWNLIHQATWWCRPNPFLRRLFPLTGLQLMNTRSGTRTHTHTRTRIRIRNLIAVLCVQLVNWALANHTGLSQQHQCRSQPPIQPGFRCVPRANKTRALSETVTSGTVKSCQSLHVGADEHISLPRSLAISLSLSGQHALYKKQSTEHSRSPFCSTPAS